MVGVVVVAWVWVVVRMVGGGGVAIVVVMRVCGEMCGKKNRVGKTVLTEMVVLKLISEAGIRPPFIDITGPLPTPILLTCLRARSLTLQTVSVPRTSTRQHRTHA